MGNVSNLTRFFVFVMWYNGVMKNLINRESSVFLNLTITAINKLITNIVPDFYELSKTKINGSIFKSKEKTGEVYRNYLHFSSNKYSKVKTLLYRNEPQNLSEVYVQSHLQRQIQNISINDPQKNIDTSNSNKIFLVNNKVIITGTGGIGKSFLMRHIFVNQIEQETSIPIFVELKGISSFNDPINFNLLDFIHKNIISQKLNLNLEEFCYTLEKGIYTIILDGFDEINSAFQDRVQEELIKISDLYSKNNYIVSSRPLDNFIGWGTFAEYKILKLDKEQAIQLIERLNYDEGVKKRFLKALTADLGIYNRYKDFASIPLLLTIMLLVYEEDANMPENLTEFYNQAFYTLYLKHDASKSGYEREKKAKLSPENFKEIVSYIAMQTFLRNQIEFTHGEINDYAKLYKGNIKFDSSDFIDDATKAVCLLIAEGGKFFFIHRSFQEYFSAIGVSKLPDDKQKKIFNGWNEQNNFPLKQNRTFVITLLTIQEDRTNLNLFVPIIEKLQKQYEEEFDHNFDKMIPAVLSELKINNKGSNISIRANDSICPSFFDLVEFTINHREDNIGNESSLLDELNQELKQERKIRKNVNISFDLKKIYLNEETLLNRKIKEYVTCWFSNRYTLLKNFKEKAKSNNITRKRKFEALLNDL